MKPINTKSSTQTYHSNLSVSGNRFQFSKVISLWKVVRSYKLMGKEGIFFPGVYGSDSGLELTVVRFKGC